MPKIVDHDVRRLELAEALWRIIVREGLEAVSVRNVAAEAGWSAGALRHYFPDKAGLIAFAMNLVTERVVTRLRSLDRGGDPGKFVLRALEELLPLDAERRVEAEVWLAFVTHARVDPALAGPAQRVHTTLRNYVEELLTHLGAPHPAAEAPLLHALLDGLTLHLLLYPGSLTPAQAGHQLQAFVRRGRTPARRRSDGSVLAPQTITARRSPGSGP
ncbi:MAG: TetR/AcrR family transcriptional regulator [Streptosporangiaceae bacterium]